MIIGIDLFENRLEMAIKMGATHIINSRDADPKEEILNILGPGGADVVVDNTGLPEIIELSYELTKADGRTILVGVPQKGNNISIHSLPLHFGKMITGSHGGEAYPADDIPRYIKMFKAGSLKLKNLITHEFPLDEINEAVNSMRTGVVSGRCIIQM